MPYLWSESAALQRSDEARRLRVVGRSVGLWLVNVGRQSTDGGRGWMESDVPMAAHGLGASSGSSESRTVSVAFSQCGFGCEGSEVTGEGG